MARTIPGERHTIFFAGAAALMMIAHMQGGKTVRDALFLSYFNVTDLPKMMMATGLFSALAVVAFSRMLSRYGPAKITPPLFILSGIISVGEWMGMGTWPHIVTVVLYLHVTVLDSLMVSGFFSIINERYDPYSAKTVISRMAIFTTLGGLLGAGAAGVVAKAIDTRTVIAMLAMLHILAGWSLYQVTSGHVGRQVSTGAPQSLFTIVRQNKLIQRMALLMLTLAATIALLDYLFKATLQANLSKAELVTFFAYFYIGIDIGSLIFHTLIGSKALRWFGLGGTIIVLPFSILFGGLITYFFRSLMSVTLLRGAASLITNSFFGPGFELLFTPISPVDKRASKILIDVGAYRSGNMLGSFMIMGLLLLPGATGSYILLTAMLLAGVMALLIFLLNRGYILQLATNLRSGTLAPAELEIKDKTTEKTVALTQIRLERDSLLKQISVYRSQDIPAALQSDKIENPARAPEYIATGTDDDPELEAIRDLRSGDEVRIRRVLVNRSLTPGLLPHVLPLLRSAGVLEEALNAVKPLVSGACGQLVDALLDRRRHPLIRRRIALLLGQADNERALQGLIAGLQDSALDVRFRCAEALGRIKTNHPHLPVDNAAIWRAAYREIAHVKRSGDQSTQGVEPLRHLFNLFGIIFGTNEMNICYDALRAEDPAIRGTALEYLDNQLPQDIRTPLWPLIAAGQSEPKSDRSAQEIMRDLSKLDRLINPKEQNARKS